MGRFLSQKTMQFLIIFAIITIAFILATLFTSLTETSINLSSTTEVPLGTEEFKRTVESITNSSALALDSNIEIFTDGRLFLADFLEEIRGAENSVTVTNYIFKKGHMTNSILEALTEKAPEGVEVRVLLDAHGGSQAPEETLRKLEEAGGVISYFRPRSFHTITRIHRRTHMRAMVIDGRVGYVGGLAFDDAWLSDGTGPEMWRDAMFKFEGALARVAQNQFNNLWRQTDGEILTGEKFFPELPAYPRGGSQSDSYFVGLFHSPAPDVSADLLNLIWLSITGAKSHIYLVTPYLTPPQEILEALEAAVRRGVRVEILVPGPYTDTKIVQSATRSYYEKLLEMGVQIFEYQPGRFHQKFLTADGHWSLIGSANMDNRSATLNVENAFGIEDEKFAKDLETEFIENKERSVEVTKENWNPNIFKRGYYFLTTLFVKQF
jgi:cardiolipin synthase A/B